MKKILVPILFLGINIINSQQAKIQTDDFEIVSASPGLDYVLNHAIRSAHNALSFHKKLFNYKPNEKIFVLFTDFGDYGNEKVVKKGKEPINVREEILSDIWAANKTVHNGKWYVELSQVAEIIGGDNGE